MHADTEVAEAQASSQWTAQYSPLPSLWWHGGRGHLFMVLFLAGNGIYQSVRERIAEFAMLKTLGFSDRGVTALVFAEAAIPVFGCGLSGSRWRRNLPRKYPA